MSPVDGVKLSVRNIRDAAFLMCFPYGFHFTANNVAGEQEEQCHIEKLERSRAEEINRWTRKALSIDGHSRRG